MDWKKRAREVADGAPIAADAGLFGVSVPLDDASLVILPAPWDGTASYGKGTALGPAAIKQASHQLDFFDLDYGVAVCAGIACDQTDQRFPFCKSHHIGEVNAASAKINEVIYDAAATNLARGALVGVLGGEHSVPFGLIKALGEHHSSFGILHIDAHHDLRSAYEGFEHSHASIMYNVLEKIPQASKLVSVGIRDFSHGEYSYAKQQGARITTYYDRDLSLRKASGETWLSIAKEIVSGLPDKIYISFDIDGLEQSLCPNTGTPVPGGIGFVEAEILLRELLNQKKVVIGFDLCEVAPGDRDEWDANVGARLLYKLCGLSLATNNKRVDL